MIKSKQDLIQEEIVNKCLDFFKKDNKGYLNATMRFGKIKTTLDFLSKHFSYHGPTGLIAYPDNRILESWKIDMEKWHYDNPNITFVNFSSLWKYKDMIFDFFIIDEFHSASPLERDYCHQIMTNDTTVLTLALSGTVSKETQRLWGLKEVAKYTTDDGIEDEILADYKVTVHFVPLDTKVKIPNKKGKLLSEKQKYDNYTYVINSFKKEGKDTMHLLLSRNRLSTSSLGKMNYLKSLLNQLKDKRTIVFAGLTEVADNIGIPTFHNKSKDNGNFEKFQKKEINHLGLANMAKMGVSFSDLDSVILLNATANQESTAQMCMRAIKLDYEGKIADIHIIALNEEAEKEKISRTLKMLDKSKIKYLYV